MSLMHPMEARSCTSCDYRWFAEAGYSSLKPGRIIFGAGQNTALAHSRSRYEQHKFCQRCGSNKVRTVRDKRSFVPTAAEAGRQAVAAAALTAAASLQRQTPPPPAVYSPRPSATGEFQPSFALPTSSVLVDRLQPPARRPSLGLGDHVHDVSCAEGKCHRLADPLPSRSPLRYVTFVGWLIVALFVWLVQYMIVVPLSCIGAVTNSPKARAWTFVAVFSGFGFAYSLYFLGVDRVPRSALKPWGLTPRAE